jgi:hypothetical protein
VYGRGAARVRHGREAYFALLDLHREILAAHA